MATDQTGRTVALDEVYLLGGRVRRIESNDLLVVLGNNNVSALRAKAADLVRVDDIVVRDGSRPFTAPQSQTALPTAAEHLTPKLYVDNADNALIAVALSIFQPLDATLLALAGAATGADLLAYFTGTDTVATTPFTLAARRLLDDTTEGAMRTTLGLGTIATVNSPVPVANGGTGSTTAEAARTALGLGALATGDDARDVPIDTSGLTGALAGSGIATLKDLVEWLDANLAL